MRTIGAANELPTGLIGLRAALLTTEIPNEGDQRDRKAPKWVLENFPLRGTIE
jgi:hypothetical protein